MTKHYSFIIIGGGSAGYAAARTAADANLNVAIIDSAEKLGGLCILKGCMPSKTLIYTAEVKHLVDQAKSLGLEIPQAQVNMAILQKRKERLIGGFAKYRTDQLESERFDLYRTNAQFKDERTLELGTREILTADKFVIATGSKISTPDIPGLREIKFLTSDDVLNLETIPESIIVLGGGVIACELAQFLQRAGSQVTLIQRSAHILKEGPIDASIELENVLRLEGMKVYTETQLQSVSQEGGITEVSFLHQGEEVTETASSLFNALGRKPNTGGLKLENAKVKLLESGHVQTNNYQQTTNANIYAAGDCSGPHEIVHIAILQGECAVKHSLNKAVEPYREEDLVKAIFTDPQIATAGLSQKELDKRRIPYLESSYRFERHGKSKVMDATHGYIKIFAHAKEGYVLGAECVSKDASELIHAMAVAVTLRATIKDLLQVHWYHPTLSEIWTYPLEDIDEQLPKNNPLCL